MKLYLRMAASFLLLFNGVGALYGGWNLITHPDGSTLKMSVDILVYSPFSDFFIPGILLFLTNGVISILVLGTLLFQTKNYPFYIKLEGFILLGWLVTQTIMIQMIVPLHVVLAAISVLMILSGRMLQRLDRSYYAIQNHF